MKCAAAIGLLVCAGCMTPARSRTYMVTDDFVVVVTSPALIESMAGLGVAGVNFEGRIIYVPATGRMDAAGNALPDFYVLGEEVWHLRELGGLDWHRATWGKEEK